MSVKEWQSRQAALMGEENINRLSSTRVIIFGVGGVGSYAAEALARCGVGTIFIVDGDTVSESNINRQLIADTTTIGRQKAEVAVERIKKINPNCNTTAICEYADETNTSKIISDSQCDFIIDAIDCISAKICIAEYAAKNSIRIISSMGTGNKLDPSKFVVSDISKTSVCPLARIMRKELRNRGIFHMPVLFSTEPPAKTGIKAPASVSFVPSVAGLLIAGYAVNQIIK